MKKKGFLSLLVLLLALALAPHAFAAVDVQCVRADPFWYGAPHPVISGEPTTLKGVAVDDTGVIWDAVSWCGIEEVQYDWDFGDGTPPESFMVTLSDPGASDLSHTVTHTYSLVGTYYATMNVLNAQDMSPVGTATVTIVVDAATAGIPQDLTAAVPNPGASPLSYEWEFDDGSPVQSGSVCNPYAIEVEHLYADIPSPSYAATLTVTDRNDGSTDADVYPVEIYQPYDDWARARAATGKGLWWAHKQIRRGPPVNPPPWAPPYPGVGYYVFDAQGDMQDAATIILAQGFVDNGFKAFGDPGDPYVDDVRGLVEYVSAKIVSVPIGPKGDGSPQFPFLDPEEGSPAANGWGMYFSGHFPEFEAGAALRLMATYDQGLGQDYWMVQEMVDYLAWAQLYQFGDNYGDPWFATPGYAVKDPAVLVPDETRGSWPYWSQGFNMGGNPDPGYLQGGVGDVAVGYWAVNGLAAAEQSGAIVPGFVRAELRRFLANNQDLQGDSMINPYYGELYFGPARAHHLVERAGEGLMMFGWLGMGMCPENQEVEAAADYINRHWMRHNYEHYTQWPWDPFYWERESHPCWGDDCYSHFSYDDFYQSGHWEMSDDPLNPYPEWVPDETLQQMNIFGFLAVAKGARVYEMTGAPVPYPPYHGDYMNLMINNQKADGSWDDSGWITGFPIGQGWALMLMARLTDNLPPWEEYPQVNPDTDGDGWDQCNGDCNDYDGSINPAAPEIPYNDIDENCNGMDDDMDADGDGYPVPEDCDDNDPAIHPDAEEVCDNLDNDCDGSTDEDLTQPTTCGTGECAGNSGIETCAAGAWGNDTCDATAGATAETCDNLDNDCDGTIDEGLTRPTTCGVGECAGNSGTETCDAGIWGDDTCDPLAGASAETKADKGTCRDTLDNDCDSLIDRDDPGCQGGGDGGGGGGREKNCSDGIDNDNDGSIDCDDSDCAKKCKN